MQEKISFKKHLFPELFWLFKSINKQQHPAHESRAVCQTHEAERQHSDEGGVDGSLHQQGHTGKVPGGHFSQVLLTFTRMLVKMWDV